MSSLIDLFTEATGVAQHRDKVYGVVVGIVRDINDPENLGRVKVDFPWLAEDSEAVTTSSDEERAHSYWARIATMMAGGGRGAFFIPEVGDEVLVAFEHGELSRPFILGALWNADDAPPESMEEGNHVRAIHSRSGHVIRFDDSDDAPQVTIQSQGGHTLVLSDASDQNKIELATAGGHSVVLDDAGGTVTIEDSLGNQIVLDANGGSVTVEASGNCQVVVGASSLDIEAGGTVTISAPSGVTIDSTSIKLGNSAAMTLVNDTFLDIFNTHTHVGNMGAPTSPPAVPAIKNVQSTIFTKGA
jgi:uncharacterized protein involved in type VI secretion and phage assembly